MDASLKALVTEHLKSFITPGRLESLQAVVNNRTSRVAVILEDIYQPHNASAVLRSCDCFGIQNVFSIEDRNTLDISSGVTRKAHQWLSLNRYRSFDDNLARCFSEVRAKGYTIAATSPHHEDVLIGDLPLDRPVAIMFGTEKEGISKRALEMADVRVRIPTYGFSESLNVSVSAAICLYETVERLRKECSSEQLKLTEEEKADILYDWLKESVNMSAIIEEKYLANHRKEQRA